MGKKFDVGALLNDASKAAFVNMQYDIEFIKIDELIPSKENFYSTESIEGLKTLIEFAGLQQNLVVWNDEGVYKILSGHRRHKAMTLLFNEGNTIYERVPCLIIEAETLEDAELQLLIGNIENRQHNDYEKMQQATRFGEIIELKRQKGEEIKGRKRDLVADMLNISKTQVGRYQSIDSNLIPELKDEFKQGEINLTTAAELARLDKEKQEEKLQKIKQGEKVTATTISKEKNESSKAKMQEVEDQSDGFSFEVHTEVVENELVETETIFVADEKSDPKSKVVKDVSIMDTKIYRIFVSDKGKEKAIENYIKQYTGKLDVVTENISMYQKIGRNPNKNDLDEQLEFQIIVEALELLRKQVN